ncbi:ankyrin repeat domain-containing protein [Rhizobium herbae]
MIDNTMIVQAQQMPSRTQLQEMLFIAARTGRDDMIPDLLRAGADIEGRDPKGYTAIVLASYNGQPSTTQLLLSLGANPDSGDTERGNTALIGVCYKGYPEIVKELVAAGADANARNVIGQTALMMAVLFNQTEIIDLLLEAGADPTIADLNGNTVQTLAHLHGRTELIQRFSNGHRPV